MFSLHILQYPGRSDTGVCWPIKTAHSSELFDEDDEEDEDEDDELLSLETYIASFSSLFDIFLKFLHLLFKITNITRNEYLFVLMILNCLK